MSLQAHSSELPSVGATPLSAARGLLHVPAAVPGELLLIDLLLISRRCGTLA
jgi:hypothetical protein